MSDLIKAAEELYLYGFPLIVTEATHRGSDDKGFVHLREFPTEKSAGHSSETRLILLIYRK